VNLVDKVQKLRIVGLAFTAFEVIMHIYLAVFLVHNWEGEAFNWVGLGFTVFEVIMNGYLFIYLLINKED